MKLINGHSSLCSIKPITTSKIGKLTVVCLFHILEFISSSRPFSSILEVEQHQVDVRNKWKLCFGHHLKTVTHCTVFNFPVCGKQMSLPVKTREAPGLLWAAPPPLPTPTQSSSICPNLYQLLSES